MKLTRNELKNKIIDAHTHAGISLNAYFDDKYPYCYSVLDIANELDKTSQDVACVFPFPSYICGTNIPNLSEKQIFSLRDIFEPIPYKKSIEKLLLEIKRFNLKKILPFGMFSVNYSVEEQVEFLESISDKIYGLKYYPDADCKNISLLATDGKPFIDYLITHNLPLVLHVSESPCLNGTGFSSVEEAIDLAMLFPELRICVAHMGHFSKKALNRVRELNLSNFFMDVSPLLHICHIRTINSLKSLELDYTSPLMVLNKLLDMFPDQLIWGTDMPFNFTCNLANQKHNFNYVDFSIEKHIDILNDLEEDKKLKLSNTNTLRLLFGDNYD